LTTNTPTIFVGPDTTQYHLVIFRHQDCICLFVVNLGSITQSFLDQVKDILLPNLGFIAPIVNAISRKLVKVDQFHYLYFNHMNLALKNTLENNALPNDVSQVLNKMHKDFEIDKNLNELYIGTQNGWIVGKKSDQREFYIVFDQKTATLLEIAEEVKKLCSSYFKDIFLD